MLMFQEGWRNCGIGDGLVGRNGAGVGARWDVCRGWMGQGRERVAREGDVFFGYVGANGSGVSEGCGRGVRWGVRGTLAKRYGERKAMTVDSERSNIHLPDP